MVILRATQKPFWRLLVESGSPPLCSRGGLDIGLRARSRRIGRRHAGEGGGEFAADQGFAQNLGDARLGQDVGADVRAGPGREPVRAARQDRRGRPRATARLSARDVLQAMRIASNRPGSVPACASGRLIRAFGIRPARTASAASISSAPSNRAWSLTMTSTVSPRPNGSDARGASGAARPVPGLAGTHASKQLPRPTVLRTFIAPSWSATISCTVARPRPVPPDLVVKKGSKRRRATCSSKPRPVSLTATRT